jgi:hypothetical protein
MGLIAVIGQSPQRQHQEHNNNAVIEALSSLSSVYNSSVCV